MFKYFQKTVFSIFVYRQVKIAPNKEGKLSVISLKTSAIQNGFN